MNSLFHVERFGGPEKGRLFIVDKESISLTAKTVEGAALTFQGIDDIHGGYGLSFGVLGVSHSVSDDVLKEDLENTSGFLVDEAGNALDTATASQSANSGLGDALDVIA